MLAAVAGWGAEAAAAATTWIIAVPMVMTLAIPA